MSLSPNLPIGPYSFIDYTDPAAAFRAYDPRYRDVASRVAKLIHSIAPSLMVEHIGSSAIPGCAGKGVIDLMILYAPGEFIAARDAIDALGFQPYAAPGAHPEERPVRIGTLVHDGDPFRVHAHIIGADAPEVADQRRFRDRLRADPALVAEYVDVKQAVLDAGVADSAAYNDGKDAFIKRVMAS